MNWSDRVLVALGGVSGGLGVALAAVAAHVSGGGNLETASRFLMLHAPALLALGVFGGAGLSRAWLARLAGALLAAGLVLFCGDLSVRALWGIAPIRLAAPIGGSLLILGWLCVVLAALWPRSR